MEELVKRLTEAFGPSGWEKPVRDLIMVEVKDLADDVRVDIMGNLIALKRGRDSGRKVMLAGHMDEIGVMATWIDDKGFIRFTNIGGLRALRLDGNRVQFSNGTIGVIGTEKLDDPNRVPGMDKMYIDVGARDKASCPVKIGDVGVFARPFVAQNGRWIAKAMDDRIACAVMIEALRGLGTPAYDTYFVFTVQEEVGLRGAITSAYGVAPEIGIAVDVCPVGDTPQAHPMAVELGGGAAINVKDASVISHPGLRNWLVKVAEENNIAYQLEVLEAGGTDAGAMQRSREGVAATTLSIPTRHIHSPSEMVDEGDVKACVALLKAVLVKPIELA